MGLNMNKQIKFILAQVALLLLLISMVACSGGNSNQQNSITPSSDTNEDETANTINYPSEEIKLIVPAEAGGTLDLAPRAMAQAFQEMTGQPLVVENQPGGGMVPGAMKMIRAEADGYTLAMLPSGLLSLRPAFQSVDFTF